MPNAESMSCSSFWPFFLSDVEGKGSALNGKVEATV